MDKDKNGHGSELHRLKPMQDGYDEELFNKLYRICKPVIRKLTRQIDCKRFNLTSDIISSFFWDKMIYVFNKYYGTCSEEHLKASILSSLALFKNKLLRSAYNGQAEYNQTLDKLDDLFDDSKEFVDDTESEKAKTEMLKLVYDYMEKNLSSDAFLVFQTIMTPPPYIKERIGEGKKITNLLLVEFFDLPKTRSSVKFISELREDILYWENRATEELNY